MVNHLFLERCADARLPATVALTLLSQTLRCRFVEPIATGWFGTIADVHLQPSLQFFNVLLQIEY